MDVATTLSTLPTGPLTIRQLNGTDMQVSPYPVGQPGGTLRVASIGQGPKTFNPWVAKDSTSSSMGGMLTAGLVTSHAVTGQVIPDLAKTVVISPNHTTYTVTLRQGLTWSDGHPLTAADVTFTWNTIIKRGLGNASLRDNTLVDGKFPAVRQLDSHTIRFTTAKPFAPFARQLGMPIAPKHIFGPIINQPNGDAAFNASWGVDAAMTHPEQLISCGQWVLKQYDAANQQVTFAPNPHFAMVDTDGQQLPYLHGYTVRFVNDMNAMALLFEQGALDIYPVPGQYVSHVRHLTEPDFTLYNLGPSDTKTFLFFNLNNRTNPSSGQPIVTPIHAAWFQNRHFRQAVDWAVNRDDMVANILKGVGQPAYIAESPASPFVDAELAKGHPQDIEHARALLKEGGFSWDSNNTLHDAKGNPVRFELLTNSGNDQRENLGVMIAEDLAQLGMQVDFRPVEFNVLIGRYDTGEWEASIMGLGGGSPLEPHDGANVWKSDAALHMFNQRKPGKNGKVDINDRYPWEAQLDTIFEQGAQTFALEDRKAIYQQYQAIVAKEHPFIYLITPLSLSAVHRRVHNAFPSPLGGTTHNSYSLWIHPTP